MQTFSPTEPSRKALWYELKLPLLLASAQFILFFIVQNNYNYFRDELYYIACSDHLAWGYVDQPPFSILLLKITRFLFGDSLHAIRISASLAISIVIVLSALIARKLGGGKLAQFFASLAVVTAPGVISHGRSFSMNSFDVLCWTVALYILVTIFVEDRPSLWLWFGIVVGIGLDNKYSIGFLCIGIFGGMLFSQQRKHLFTKHFWLGVIVASIIFLPHILWEIANKLPSIEFMQNASRDKNVHLSIAEFFMGQVRDINFINAPIWLAGIGYFFVSNRGKTYRSLGWLYIFVFIVMITTHTKVYYLTPVYPFLLASGAVTFELIIEKYHLRKLKISYPIGMALSALVALPFAIPILPVDQFISYQNALGIHPRQEERNSLSALPQYYADEFGWEEMVKQFAGAYNTLTPEEKSQCVLYVRNYGEAAAIDFYGRKYGLPRATCAHNNYWLWGPGDKTGNIAIILGWSYELNENLNDLKGVYSEINFVATTHNTYAMPFENERQIFICKGMKTTFQAIWEHEKHFI